MTKIEELDRIALLRDLPDANLRAGDPGTVVHVYRDGKIEVEFVDREGYTVGLITLAPEEVRIATSADRDRRAIGRRDLYYDSVESQPRSRS
jgi:hypothetical protein